MGLNLLPLGRFPALRSGGPAEAFNNIRSRHPGARALVPVGGREPWTIDINAVSLGSIRIAVSDASAFTIDHLDDGLVRILMPLNMPVRVLSGGLARDCGAGEVWLLPATGHRLHVPEGSKTIVIAVPTHAIQETLLSLDLECDLPSVLERRFRTHARATGLLRRQLAEVLRAFDEMPDAIIDQIRFRNAHEELLLLSIADEIARDCNPASARPSHVSRALEFMQANCSDEIGPAAIAKAAGCGLRNLQLMFKRECGMTITQALRDLRLKAARARLLHPDDGDTITAVASDCGLSHLSDFARHYRRAYGEKPSTTLFSAKRAV